MMMTKHKGVSAVKPLFSSANLWESNVMIPIGELPDSKYIVVFNPHAWTAKLNIE